MFLNKRNSAFQEYSNYKIQPPPKAAGPTPALTHAVCPSLASSLAKL